jgi:hypothetical protein
MRHLLLPLLLSAFLSPAAGPLHKAGTPGQPAAVSGSGPLTLVQTVALPQITGGMNHLAADAKRHRFFVTAPGEKKVAVVDLKTAKVLRVLAGPATAARFLPDVDQLCVAGARTVAFYDGASLMLVGAVDLPSTLDELQYDAREKQLYVGMMDNDKPGIAVLGVPHRKLLDQLRLPAKPQGFVVEANGSRIFANTPGAGQVTVIDRNRRALAAEWKLTAARSNYPIALDEKNQRLFVACRKPATLLVLDSVSGNQVASIAIGGDADDMAFDAAAKHIYVACGDGVITTIRQVDANHYEKLPDTPTVEGARNALLEEDLRTFYLVVPRRGNAPAQLRAYQARH